MAKYLFKKDSAICNLIEKSTIVTLIQIWGMEFTPKKQNARDNG